MATPPMTMAVSAPMTQAASRSVATAASAVLGATGVASVMSREKPASRWAWCPPEPAIGGDSICPQKPSGRPCSRRFAAPGTMPRMAGSAPTPPSRWYYRPWSVVFLLFFVLGPFGLHRSARPGLPSGCRLHRRGSRVSTFARSQPASMPRASQMFSKANTLDRSSLTIQASASRRSLLARSRVAWALVRRLRPLVFQKRAPLVCEPKRSGTVVEGDVFVRNETFHELRERLMSSLVEDQAMGVEVSHRDQAALLCYEFQQALSGCVDVCGHRFPPDPLRRERGRHRPQVSGSISTLAMGKVSTPGDGGASSPDFVTWKIAGLKCFTQMSASSRLKVWTQPRVTE